MGTYHTLTARSTAMETHFSPLQFKWISFGAATVTTSLLWPSTVDTGRTCHRGSVLSIWSSSWITWADISDYSNSWVEPSYLPWSPLTTFCPDLYSGRCDVCVCVQALSSGYSSEVHGLFTVTQTATQSSSDASRRCIGKDTNNSAIGSVKSASAVQRQVVHYKALDSGVRCCLSNNTWHYTTAHHIISYHVAPRHITFD